MTESKLRITLQTEQMKAKIRSVIMTPPIIPAFYGILAHPALLQYYIALLTFHTTFPKINILWFISGQS